MVKKATFLMAGSSLLIEFSTAESTDPLSAKDDQSTSDSTLTDINVYPSPLLLNLLVQDVVSTGPNHLQTTFPSGSLGGE